MTSKKLVMTSKSSTWRQNTSWRQKVRHCVQKTRHDVKKYVTASKIRHDVKKFVMMLNKFVLTPKRSSWRLRHVMTSTSSSWHQKYVNKVRHDVKACHDAKKFIMTSKTMPHIATLNLQSVPYSLHVSQQTITFTLSVIVLHKILQVVIGQACPIGHRGI